MHRTRGQAHVLNNSVLTELSTSCRIHATAVGLYVDRLLDVGVLINGRREMAARPFGEKEIG